MNPPTTDKLRTWVFWSVDYINSENENNTNLFSFYKEKLNN